MDDNLNLDDILAIKREPRTIVRDKTILETETLSENRQLIEFRGQRMVAEIVVIKTVTKYVKIREWNPELSIADALDEFTETDPNG